jgi:hypothetical protein
MLEPILTAKNAERVLVFICVREQGYTREIAKFYGVDPDSIQKQLMKFQMGGVLTSKSEGRTKIYRFSPRYPFRKELEALLTKAISFYPPEEQERLLMVRRRPRREGKPL